jgi:hypothetical protein
MVSVLRKFWDSPKKLRPSDWYVLCEARIGSDSRSREDRFLRSKLRPSNEERSLFAAGALKLLYGQLLTRLATFTLPKPVAKSHPGLVGYAILRVLSDVESTP